MFWNTYYEVYKNKEMKYADQKNVKIFKMKKMTRIFFCSAAILCHLFYISIISEYSKLVFFHTAFAEVFFYKEGLYL